MWSELIELPDIGAATSLRTVVSGGEALPSALAQRLRAALPAPRKINLYGPTETTINATWFDFTGADDSDTAIVPIGRPVDGCATVVVDEADRRVEGSQVGELLISGVQLAEGYRNRPDATAARFVELAFDTAERWYRTGDLVRGRDDGVLEFVGRNDEQVKVNGHRVETNEVRVSIEAHHWVRSAAVVPWLPERGATQLAGFIELDPDEAPLMDQGRAGRHHRSKSTRVQVTAQLADLAVPQFTTEPEIPLAGAEPTGEQRRRVFARKTYRTFTEKPIDLGAIESMLGQLPSHGRELGPRGALTAVELGSLLRWLGPFHSPNRLLAKYSYASPARSTPPGYTSRPPEYPDWPQGCTTSIPCATHCSESARRPGPAYTCIWLACPRSSSPCTRPTSGRCCTSRPDTSSAYSTKWPPSTASKYGRPVCGSWMAWTRAS